MSPPDSSLLPGFEWEDAQEPSPADGTPAPAPAAKRSTPTALTRPAPLPGFVFQDTLQRPVADQSVVDDYGAGDAVADLSREFGGALTSATGYGLRGFGEMARVAATPVVSAVNTIAGEDVLPQPVNPLTTPAGWLERQGEEIQAGESQHFQQEMAESTPQGDIFEGEFNLGSDPSLLGYAGQLANVAGQVAPVLATAALTRGGSVVRQLGTGAGISAAQGGGAAAQQEGERIRAMPQAELAKLPAYAAMLDRGLNPDQAREQLALATERSTFARTAPVSSLSGLVLAGGLTKPVQAGLTRLVGERLVPRIGTAIAAEAPAEGLQEVAEQAAQTHGANVATGEDRSLTEGSAANLTLGALGGGLGGVAAGLARPKGPIERAADAAPTQPGAETDQPATAEKSAAGTTGPVVVPDAPWVANGKPTRKPDAAELRVALHQMADRRDAGEPVPSASDVIAAWGIPREELMREVAVVKAGRSAGLTTKDAEAAAANQQAARSESPNVAQQPATESATPEPQASAFRVEQRGEKGLIVHGDSEAARARLAEAGINKRGRALKGGGGLRFDAKDRAAIENALGLAGDVPGTEASATAAPSPVETAPDGRQAAGAQADLPSLPDRQNAANVSETSTIIAENPLNAPNEVQGDQTETAPITGQTMPEGENSGRDSQDEVGTDRHAGEDQTFAVDAPGTPGLAATNDQAIAPPVATEESVGEAAAAAATSPANNLPDATPAQREAGNFKVGRMKIGGLDVSIEYPKGVKRKPDHKPLTRAYGYIRGTVGNDKDHVDVFLGENAANPDLPVFVVDQVTKDGTFDEHKVILGEQTEDAARQAYLSNYPKDWNGLGGITKMTQDEFRQWAQDPARTKKPANQTTAALDARPSAEEAAPAAPEPQASTFRVEQRGEKGLIVHGDPEAARARLAEAGFNKRGRAAKGGGLRFDAKDRVAIENALGLAAAPARDPQAPAAPAPAKTRKPLTGQQVQAQIAAEADANKEAIKEHGFKAGDRVTFQNGAGRIVEGTIAKGDRVKLARDRGIFYVEYPGRNGGTATVTIGARKLTKVQPQEPAQSSSPPAAEKPAPKPDDTAQAAAEAPAEAGAQDSLDRFKNNTVFTADKVAQARARLKAKLGQLNSGIDPEVMLDGITIAGAYIEAGTRKFGDYAKAMVDDFGDAVKPYLLSFYEAVRHYPGASTEGMDSADEAQRQFDGLIRPADLATEAVGNAKPPRKTRAKASSDRGSLPLFNDAQNATIAGDQPEAERGSVGVENPAEKAQNTQEETTDDDQTRNRENQGGTPTVRAGRGDSQPASAPPDSGRVGQVQSEDDGAPQAPGDTERLRLRLPSEDVAGERAAAAVRPSRDGRAGTGRTGASAAGTGGRAEAGDSGGDRALPADVRATAEGDRGSLDGLSSPAATGATAQDFHIDDPLAVQGGTPVVRFNRNREAIELLQQLEEDGRQATRDEQATLAGYTGWGSFGQELFQGSWERAVFKDDGKWKERNEWLREHLGESAWKSAQRSITNAHYTDPPTILAMWNMVARAGFNGGRVLEPAMGIGNFYTMMPADLATRSERTGIELDESTGAIAKQLFPKSNIRIMGYQDSKTPDGFYDLIIGNWPFENTPVADRRYNKFKPFLHDYFFLKTLDQVRPGGLVLGITSAGTMDKKSTTIRREMAKQAELVASIRLPSGAFEEYAGTSVVTDILVLRKRPERLAAVPADTDWVEVVDAPTPSGQSVRINAYYEKNPTHILGELDFGTGTTSGRPGMIVHRPDDLAARLTAAVALVPEGAMRPRRDTEHINYTANATGERHGALSIVDGKLVVAHGDQLAPASEIAKYKLKSADATAKRTAQLTDLVEMRKKYVALVDAQRSDGKAGVKRTALRQAVEAFRETNGSLRGAWGMKYLEKIGDPFAAALAALEGDNGALAEILRKNTTRTKRAISNPSVTDAYVLARNESTHPTPDRIAELASKTVEEVSKELVAAGAVYIAPNGDLVPTDIYLSGNVREKLREAKAALADGNEAMERNVAALEEVVPEDIPYFNIETKLGATWVPTRQYEEYLAHMLGADDTTGIEVEFRAGRWMVRLASNLNKRQEARANYGVDVYPFSRLAQAAISNQTLRLTSRDEKGNDVHDPAKSEEANNAIAKIREDFAGWLWGDSERRVNLEREYNESRNAWATPRYDGSFLSFDGMALALGKGPFNLRQHQMDAIWRGIVHRKSINAHEVGTGKTFTMAGIAVESRRYGLARKPLLLAHNANSATVAKEINMMYPNARVLYVDNMDKAHRAVRMNQIAHDDWDVVVVPHSLIDQFALREETLMQMAQEEITDLEEMIAVAAEEDGIDLKDVDLDEEDDIKKIRSVTAKNLAKQRKRIIETIKKQSQKASRENAIAFEDLGVDMLLVDEVHEFKKPPIVTRMNMKGLNTQTSNRSIQLQFLTRYIRSMNNGGNVHTFTGTPITNTITEIYHQMRYVMDSEMDQIDVSQWDGWFGSFATEVEDVELTAAGDYEMVTRLAGFINVPELRRLVGQYMDTVFAEDMPEMTPRETASGKTITDPGLSEAERAELLNGRTEGAANRPYKKVINATAEMTEAQLAEFRTLQGYAQDWRKASKKERLELMLAGDPRSPIVTEGLANKASLDVRLLDRSLAGQEGKTKHDPGSKASRVVGNVLELYKSHKLASQVIFSEMGFNTSQRKTRKTEDGDKYTVTVKSFSTIKDIVERLVQGGIPREQIAVVDGSTKKQRRAEISEAMNSGEIRVVIGSTATLGVGVNMQRNLRAMHHLDAPYMPGELEQRNGRGQRQGNQWNTVLEYRYMTDRLDGRRWQILAVKQRFINAFMKANMKTRVIEGEAAADEQSDILESFSEAAGDPRVLQRIKLQKKLDGLHRKERLYDQGIADMRDALRRQVERLDEINQKLDRYGKDDIVANIATLIQAQRDAFQATVDGKKYDKRKDAIDALKDYIAINLRVGSKATKVGTYAGHPLRVGWPTFNDHPVTTVDAFGEEFSGNGIAGMEAMMRGFEARVENLEGLRNETNNTIDRLKEAMQRPFARADELTSTKSQLDNLGKDLAINPVPPPFWLRQGAPIDSEVYLDGKLMIVTGHRYGKDGYFVLAEDDKGNVVIPYLDAEDSAGMRLYEEHDFIAPEVIENKKPDGDKDPESESQTEADNAAQEGADEPRLSLEPANRPQADPIELSPAELDAYRRFQRGGAAGDGEAEAKRLGLRTAVDKVLGKAAKSVVFLPSAQDLPPRLRRGVEERLASRGDTAGRLRLNGLYNPQTTQVYVFTDTVRSPKKAVWTAAHELAGHHGLRALLGEKLNPALKTALRNGTVKALADSITKQRALTDDQGLLAAEEALAELAAAVRTGDYERIQSVYGVQVPEGVRQGVQGAIEGFIRRLKALLNDALGREAFTDQDVRSLLEAAWQATGGAATATLGGNGEQVLFALDTAEPFFSQLLRTIETAQGAPKKGTAAQWTGWLDGAQRRGDIKQTERDWLGVDAWLLEQDGPVTRDDLAGFVRANQVQIKDVMLGNGKPRDRLSARAWEDLSELERNDVPGHDYGANGSFVVYYGDTPLGIYFEPNAQDAVGAAEADTLGSDANLAETDARHETVKLPGGKNYRELLLTLPAKAAPPYGHIELMRNGLYRVDAPSLQSRVFKTRAEAEAETLRLGTLFKKNRDGNFRTSHFDETNILAHVRFNERPDVAGNKVLFIEEIQSDWAQGIRAHGVERNYTAQEVAQELYGRAYADMDASLQSAVDAEVEGRNNGTGGAAPTSSGTRLPDMPFKATGQWAMLAFKRMVRYAAEHGFDSIAWTTGEQQAERYDLSKHVKFVTAKWDTRAKTWALEVGYYQNGRMDNFYPGDDTLDEHVGKELAERMMANRAEAASDNGLMYSGLDLKVGGEGMRGFYDKILPTAVNKWAKKFGGKVAVSDLLRAPDFARDDPDTTRITDDGQVPMAVPSLNITAEMRKAALAGQPMFRFGGQARSSVKATGERLAMVNRVVKAGTARWGANQPLVRVLASADEMPTVAKRHPLFREAHGFYDGRTVYLVAPNLTSPRAVLKTLVHESVGHYGIDRIVEEELGKGAWDRIADSIATMDQNGTGGKAVQDVLAAVHTRYESGTRRLDRKTFAAEVLAVMSERGIRNPLVDRVVAALRAYIRKIMPKLKLSSAELGQLLVRSERYLRADGAYRAQVAARAATMFSEEAPTRRHGIPSSGGNLAALWRNVKPLKQHPDYAAAKAGDGQAAVRLVAAVAGPLVDQTKRFGSDVIYVAAHALEATGQNAIPETLAEYLSVQGGASVDTGIVQTNRAFHTGAKPAERLLVRAQFDGPVQAGKKYVLVDDVSTMGGTLADLANFIRAKGGAVVGSVVLVNASRSGTFEPKPQTLRMLERRFGDEIRNLFHVEPAALTADEANYLIGFRSVDELRNRAAKAAQERVARLGAKSIPPKGTVGRFSLPPNPDRDSSDDALFGDEPDPGENAGFAEPEGSVDTIGKILAEPDSGAWQRAKEWMAGKWEDIKPATLGALQMRHLLELAEDIPALRGAHRYANEMQAMDADRNQLLMGDPNAGDKPGDMLARGAAPLTEEMRKYSYAGGVAGYLGRKNPEAQRLFKLMHDATIQGLDPAEVYQRIKVQDARGRWQGWTVEMVRDRIKNITEQIRGRPGDDKQRLMDERKMLRGLARREKRREKSWPALVRRYNALSPEAKKIYGNTRDWYAAHRNAVEQALLDRIEAMDMPDTYRRSLQDRIRVQFEAQRQDGVYFPLDRNGEYWISVVDADGQPGFVMFETAKDQAAAERKLTREGFQIEATGRRDTTYRAKDAPPGTFVSDVVRLLQQSGAPTKVQDEIYQMFLRSLPELSMRKKFIHRKAIPGYSEDALRAFAKNSFHGSHQLARLRHSQNLELMVEGMEEAVNSARKGDARDEQNRPISALQVARADSLLGEIKRRHDWILSPKDSNLANMATGIGFMYYLGLSPASALVNLTQGAQVTLPVLGAKHGWDKAGAALARATGQALRTGGNVKRTLSGDELTAYKELEGRGDIERTQVHTIAGVAEGNMLEMTPAWAKSMTVMSFLFHKAEIVNREAAAMAAYRLGRADGMEHDAAVQYASDTINKTQFDYSNANRARYMQGGVQKVLFQFKNYALGMTWLLYRNAWKAVKGETKEVKREALRTVTGVLGMTSIFAGVVGLPVINAMAMIANAVHAAVGDDDEPWDFQTEFRAWLAEHFGETGADVIASGLVDQLGASVSTRVGLSNLWFRTADRQLEGRDAYYHFLETIAGPMGGMAKNLFVGMQYVEDGKVWRGVERMLPTAARNGMRALRYSAQGVNTMNGAPIVPDVAVGETVIQALGFTPEDIADQYRINNALMGYQDFIKDRRQTLLNAYAMAVHAQDTEARKATLAKIRDFNQHWPEIAIKPATIQRSLKGRARYKARAVHGMPINRKLVGRLREDVGVAGSNSP